MLTTQYLVKVAFHAQLTNSPANFVPDTEWNPRSFDFSPYALWAFPRAFEDTAKPRAPNTIMFRAAARWMIYTEDRLWENVQTRRGRRYKGNNNNRNSAGTGNAYHDSKKGHIGYNQERWEVRVKGLENELGVEDEEAKESVEKALE